MIPYIFGKLAPNSIYSIWGLVRYVPGRGYFRAVSSQNGDKFVTPPPPPPESLNGSVSCCFNFGFAHLHPGGSLPDTASKWILGVEIPYTLHQRFPLRICHRERMLGQLRILTAGRVSYFAGAVPTVLPQASTRCKVNQQ